MNPFGRSFIDLGDSTMGTPLESKLPRATWTPRDELLSGIRNAERLTPHLITAGAPPRAPVVLYLPEGRYYLAFPAGLRGMPSEQMADFLIPANVTLRFGPGATLVPMALTETELSQNYPMGRDDFLRRRLSLPMSERLRVRIEVQGFIDAPITKIFDPYMDEDVVPSVMPQRRGGLVYFQRETVREVFPEWWGAVPMRGEERDLTEGEVRRTTEALQSAIDAAFTHRVAMLQTAFDDKPVSRASIPVVLVNDYAIDRPLRLGMTLLQARARGDARDAYPPNQRGFVLRGECGPATQRGGAALIKASRWFRSENIAPGAPPGAVSPVEEFGDSRSMLIVRMRSACSVQNVVFDADDIAERCITVMTFTSAHHHALEGCELRNARYALLYIGGEFPTEARLMREPAVLGPILDAVLEHLPGQEASNSRYFSGGQDLADFRVSRCRFLTGSGEGVPLPILPVRKLPAKNMAAEPRWKHAVVYRSEQGLASEFHGCVFEGVGSPMVLLVGGRLSFQNCSFRTDLLPQAAVPSTVAVPDQAAFRWWNGTDIHIGAPYAEWLMGPAPAPFRQFVVAAMLTARNVESRSHQFLTTYPADSRFMSVNAQTFASVTLIQIRHKSDFDTARPSIYWAGPRWNGCPLIVQDSVFAARRGANPAAGSVFIGPPAEAWVDPRPVLIVGTRRVLVGRGSPPPTGPVVIMPPTGRLADDAMARPADARGLLCSTLDTVPNVMMIPTR